MACNFGSFKNKFLSLLLHVILKKPFQKLASVSLIIDSQTQKAFLDKQKWLVADKKIVELNPSIVD
jgi:hypothetical protein